jgi:hypothetical protein
VVLHAPRAVTGIIRLSDLPKSAPNAAQYKESDYAMTWPQTIAEENNSLKVYGSDFKPEIYKFAFQITFLSPGTVKLPAATIEEPYKHSCYGVSQEQTVIVDAN